MEKVGRFPKLKLWNTVPSTVFHNGVVANIIVF